MDCKDEIKALRDELAALRNELAAERASDAESVAMYRRTRERAEHLSHENAELKAQLIKLTRGNATLLASLEEASREMVYAGETMQHDREEIERLRADLADMERKLEARPDITGEEAFTWIGCRGGPTEKKVNAKLREFGMRWSATAQEDV